MITFSFSLKEERIVSKYVMALDQGTTSSRCIIFDHQGRVVAKAQKEFQQIFPKTRMGRA